MTTTAKHCKRCDNLLMGNDQRDTTCTRCLDLGYASMTQETYDALDKEDHESAHDAYPASRLTRTRYTNPRTGWQYEFVWLHEEGVVSVRSSGMAPYFMTIAGAERFILTLDPVA